MSSNVLIILLIAALITACISGIFGMAGGMIMMGVIATYLGVAEAMVVHGAVQSISNSYRAWLIRENIRWDIIGRIALGAVPALALLALAAYVPTKGVLFLVLGMLPLMLWLPLDKLALDAQKPMHAALCGFMITGLNLVAGVAGPALDMFFIKTSMPRHEIVATKAVTMFGSHMMKIAYFGIPIFLASDLSGLPPAWFFLAIIPFIMIGTFTGTKVLKKMSDVGFRKYTKWLVTVVGVIYLLRGTSLLGWI